MTSKKYTKPEQLMLDVAVMEIGDNFMTAARYFRKIHDLIPEKFSEVAKRTGIGLRKAYYLAAIDRRFNNLGVTQTRLTEIGWAKLMLLVDHINESNCEALLQLAETSTARELTLKLRKEDPLDGTRCIVLYLTPKEYGLFKDIVLAYGATQRKHGLADKEEGLINAPCALNSIIIAEPPGGSNATS